MTSRIGRFFENKFFKIRIFFVADNTVTLRKEILENPLFRSDIIRDARHLPLKVNAHDNDNANRFMKRLENPSLVLYLALDRQTSQLAAYYWTAEAKDNPLWHDKIYVEPNSVLGLDAFTLPEYRGKNAFPFLKSIAIRNTVLEGNYDYFYSVVESSNKASIRANEKLGLTVAGYNYLIKLYGRNILSIIHLNNKWEIHCVFRNSKDINV